MEEGTISNNIYYGINNFASNPNVLIVMVLFVVVYVVFFMSSFSSSSSSDSSSSFESSSDSSSSLSSSLASLLIAILIVLILIQAIKYLSGIDIITKIRNYIYGNTEVEIVIDSARADAIKAPVPEILLKPQVFNIPENDFVYPDAKAVCSAYGARLATYQEVEEAYGKGAEWCNYGWSDGQMALFPTQQKTFDELQKIEGHENDCGRPGVNGGFMSNPALKMGVNCFGFKPRMNATEQELMANEPIYPKTEKDIAMEKRVDYWKERLTEVLVSPFSHGTWSRF